MKNKLINNKSIYRFLPPYEHFLVIWNDDVR